MAERAEYVGPKTPGPAQLQGVIDLANRVFRGGGGGNLGEQFPLLYRRDRMEPLRVFECDGQPVSLVATLICDTVLLGCGVRVACIGSVCTDERHRGQGLAGRLVDDAAARAVPAGASVMLISGGRSLYTRRGAARCGRFCRYEIQRELLRKPRRRLRITEVTGDSAGAALKMYEAEPIRFRRSEQEYALQVASRWLVNRPGVTYLASRSQTPVAVMSVNRSKVSQTDPREVLGLVEMAGSRRAMLAAAAEILDRCGVETLHVHAYESDRAMLDACAEIGAAPQLRGFVGTVKLLDADRLWHDFGPLLAERIGSDALAGIRIRAEADELKIHSLSVEMPGERLTIAGPDRIAPALFGSPDLDPLAELQGPLAGTLRRALPLPLPMYGFNYV